MGVDESWCSKCNCNKRNEFNLEDQEKDKKDFTQMTTKNKQYEENNIFKIKESQLKKLIIMKQEK